MPRRPVIVGPGRWNTVGGLQTLRLPPGEDLIVTVHYYSPFRFTHQGAAWLPGSDEWLGARWGSEAEQARVGRDLEAAAAWAAPLPLFLGEFGTLETALDAGPRGVDHAGALGGRAVGPFLVLLGLRDGLRRVRPRGRRVARTLEDRASRVERGVHSKGAHNMGDGTADKLKGHAKEAAGEVTDDDSLKREGKVDRASGRVKDKVGDASDKLKDAVRKD